MKEHETAAVEPFPRLGEGESYPGELGGKGQALDRLRRRGFAVPEGFVVPAELSWAATGQPEVEAALRRLGRALEQTPPVAPGSLLRADATLEHVRELLQARVRVSLDRWSGALPCRFAVRSSAAGEDGEQHSFAGVLKTFLGVEAAHLADAILLCWAAAWSGRFLAYRRRHELDARETATGVVIQGMVDARAAGVLLTHDPVSGERGPILNAVRGLGGRLVGGSLSPDTYRREQDGSWSVSLGGQSSQDLLTSDGIVCGVLQAGEKGRAVLSRRECEALARLGAQVEATMGCPQDLEWAIEGRRLWVLQARPITSLPQPSRTWTRANLKELYPELPSPMTASLIERHKAAWIREQFSAQGFRVESPGPALRVLRGRLYFNQTLLEGLAASLGFSPAAVQQSVGGSSREAALHPDWRSVIRRIGPLARVCLTYLTAAGRARAIIRVSEQDAARLTGLPLGTSSDAQVLTAALRAFRAIEPLDDTAARVMGAIETWTVIATGLLRGAVESPGDFIAATTVADARNPTARQIHDFEVLVDRARGEAAARRWLERLQVETNDSSASQEWTGLPDELRGTRFGEGLLRFLRDHGRRAIHESDSAVPRFAEDLRPLLASIRAAVGADPDALHERREERLREEERRAWSRLAGGTQGWVPLRSWLLHLIIGRLRSLYALREEVRLAITRIIRAQRRCERELGARWARRGWLRAEADYYLLRIEDAARAVAAPETMETGWLRRRAARHGAEQRAWAAVSVPDTWTEGPEIPAAAAAETPAADGCLKGLPISPGVVEGEVAVVSGPERLAEVPPGRILVVPVVGPSWTPLFASARGAVVEMAGMLSHGAILLREYGLPAVANVSSATTLLRDGECIRVDGTHGTVERLTPEEARSAGCASRESVRQAA